MRNIYLLYSCNEWKSWDSIRLIMATTSTKKIRNEVKVQLA